MARRPRTKQINIRVPPDIEDVLEAARYVGRYRSIPELLLPEIKRIAAKLAEEEEVQATVEQRLKRDSRKSMRPSRTRRDPEAATK